MTETITLDTRKCESTVGNARIAPLRRGERGNVPLVVFVRRNLRPYDLTDMTAHLVWKAADGKLVGPVPMEVTDPATGTVRCTLPDACYSTVGTARAYVELRRGAEMVDTTDEMSVNVLDCIDADGEQAEEYKPLIAEVRDAVADAKQAMTESYNAANVANEAAVNASNASSLANEAAASANEASVNANNAADRISAYTEIIEQNKKRITSLEGTVSKQGKQIANLQGISATEETDTTEAYTKTVPTGAQKWASLDKVGGKTVVNDGELVSAEVVEVESKGTFLIPAEVRDMCPGYGWSAGTVYNEVDFERKVYVQRVGSVDLGTLDFNKGNASNIDEGYFGYFLYASDNLPQMKPSNNAVCKRFFNHHQTIIWEDMPADSFFATDYLYFQAKYDTIQDFKSAMQGVLLYFELAAPIEVDLSNVLPDDHYIEVEAGGTVTFKQASTQLPVPSSVTYQISTSEVIANA